MRACPQIRIFEDRHFLCSPAEFECHARGRKQLRMEYFYREMRVRHSVLMDGGQPCGGSWNYDQENRESFDSRGPGLIPAPVSFAPSEITRQVMRLVETRFATHPGSLDRFDWPVTATQARQALHDFLEQRLAHFGAYQDAMWIAEPYLFHSRLSAALNLKLLDPRHVVREAERRYREGRAPLAAVEGFIRQILGWREYVRGLYWRMMPHYASANALHAHLPLPEFYWTGETDMRCLREAIGQTLEYGYAHHIQRLMVTGLFALLLGVDPRQVHEWYLAVYVDAVEWVELPNTIGMSQFADGGVMASKPYIASGRYIQRMSNYCSGCRYKPEECPFTTLYWDFLDRHQAMLRNNPRMSMQLRNLDRLSQQRRVEIRDNAALLRASLHPASQA
ncbi:MAG: cryptochrome/photolyase family protein, partial [Bryobacterales bacterium]|nr:cryptochrome/photolyase family protein [Bryobacterales bacterium]